MLASSSTSPLASWKAPHRHIRRRKLISTNMSDRESSYNRQSLLGGYNPNQSRPTPSNTSGIAPKRATRASYRPALSPPPAIALPATPSFAPAPATNGYQHHHSQQLPLRISNQSPVATGRGYTTSHHPYSAHSLASTPDIDNDLSDGFSSSNERNYRPLYRSRAHQSSVSTNSQAQSLHFSTRQQTSSSTGSISQTETDLAYASTSSSPVRDRAGGVSPGSYFAAYPPVPAPLSRDRSDSEVSAGSSAHTASASAMSPVQSPPLAPAVTHRASPRSKDQTQSSSSHRHASTSHSHKSRPSSRRALTAALELAKSAVLLDQTNDDPRGAVQAYANTVRLLGEVMDRVMRGDDPPSSSTAPGNSSGTDAAAEDRKKRGRRKSNLVAKEEEVRRLKAIVSLLS